MIADHNQSRPCSCWRHLVGDISSRGAFWLALILCGGLLIRLYAAYVQPAYVDEAYNQYLLQAGPRAIIDMMALDNHTPVLLLALYPLSLLTDNIFWLRLPEVLLSVLTILLYYNILRRFCNEGPALGITAFLALDYQLWMNDTESRPYGPLTFFMALLWLVLLEFEHRDKPIYSQLGWTSVFKRERICWWGWLILAFAALGCGSMHFIGVLFLMAAFGSVMVFNLPKPTRIATLVILALGMVPGCAWLMWTRMTRPTLPAMLVSSWGEHLIVVLSLPLQLLNIPLVEYARLAQGTPWEYLCMTSVPLLSLAINILLWLIWIYCWICSFRAWKNGTILLSWCTIFPPLALAIAGMANVLALAQCRYAVPMTVGFMGIIAAAYQESQSTGQRRFARHIFALWISWTLAIDIAFPWCTGLWNQYWQGTIDKIEQISRPKDIIAVYVPYNIFTFAKAYNPQGINYSYQGNYILQCQQNPVPGKLAVMAWEPWCHDECFIMGPIRGCRLLMVTMQVQTFHNEGEFQWLSQYYDVELADWHKSVRGWGDVKLLILTPKTH